MTQMMQRTAVDEPNLSGRRETARQHEITVHETTSCQTSHMGMRKEIKATAVDWADGALAQEEVITV